MEAKADSPSSENGHLREASHILVLLTRGSADEGTTSLSHIRRAMEVRSASASRGGRSKALIFAYLKKTQDHPDGWSFETEKPPSDVQNELWNNEASSCVTACLPA